MRKTFFRLKGGRGPKTVEEDRPLEDDILNISNLDSRYKMIHGHDFKDILEPRDQVL